MTVELPLGDGTIDCPADGAVPVSIREVFAVRAGCVGNVWSKQPRCGARYLISTTLTGERKRRNTYVIDLGWP